MYDRDELAEVYVDLPRFPLYGLIDHCNDLLDSGELAELQSFRDQLEKDGSRPKALSPSDLIEALKGLIDREFPEHPFSWHVHRAVHRATMRAIPDLHWRVKGTVQAHERALRRILDVAPDRFLYVGVRLERRDERAWAHIQDWIGRDLHALACLPTGSDDLAAISRASLPIAARAVLAPLLEGATPDPADPTTLVISGDGALARAVEWLGKVLQARPELIELIDVDSLPIRVILAEDEPRTEDDDDLFTRRRKGWPLLDLGRVRLPDDPDTAANVVAGAVARHPQLARTLARQLVAAPSAAAARALAASHPETFASLVEQRWLDGLRDASELVDAANALPRLEHRLAALIAIGAPAREPLGRLVDQLITGLCDAEHALAGGGGLLQQIADGAPSLGLAFWFKRLDRPGAFPHLWRSKRIREALALHPEPLLRLLRRASERGERAVGLLVLKSLLSDVDAVDFRRLVDPILALVQEASPDLHWKHRLNLLALAGSDEALALISSSLKDVNDEDLYGSPLLVPATWDALLGCGHLTGTWLLELMLGHPGTYDLGPASARAVIDTLLDRGLKHWTDTGHRAEQGPPPVADLLLHLLQEHADALGAERLTAGRSALEGVFTPGTLSTIGRPALGAREVPELPWRHLSASDLGFLLPEVGAWFATRVTDKVWMRVNLGEVLRPAIQARFRDALGPHGAAILAQLGDRWPTRGAVEAEAGRLGVTVPDKALDRCADEAIPPVFRAALGRLHRTIEATDDTRYSDEHWIVRWVFEEVWVEAPELLARHMLPVFEATTERVWRRGLALALVALREPCGGSVPDALTRAMHNAADAEEVAFYQRQRDTFARERAAREQALPSEARTREALRRLQRYARQSRGVA